MKMNEMNRKKGYEKQKKRSSILKQGMELPNLPLYEEEVTMNDFETKRSKRVSFAETNSIKEFLALKGSGNTEWNCTYEEPAPAVDSSSSSNEGTKVLPNLRSTTAIDMQNMSIASTDFDQDVLNRTDGTDGDMNFLSSFLNLKPVPKDADLEKENQVPQSNILKGANESKKSTTLKSQPIAMQSTQSLETNRNKSSVLMEKSVNKGYTHNLKRDSSLIMEINAKKDSNYAGLSEDLNEDRASKVLTTFEMTLPVGGFINTGPELTFPDEDDHCEIENGGIDFNLTNILNSTTNVLNSTRRKSIGMDITVSNEDICNTSVVDFAKKLSESQLEMSMTMNVPLPCKRKETFLEDKTEILASNMDVTCAVPIKNVIDNLSKGQNNDDGLIPSSNNPLRFLELNKINSAIATLDNDNMTCGMEITCAVPVIKSRSFSLTEKSSIASTQPLNSNMDFTCTVPTKNVIDNSRQGKINDEDGLISSSSNPLRFLELGKINSTNKVHDDDGMEMTCAVPVINSRSFSITEKSSIASTQPLNSNMDFTCTVPTKNVIDNSREGKINDEDGLISSSCNPLRFLELGKINSTNKVHDDDGMEMTCAVPAINSRSFILAEKSSIVSTNPISSNMDFTCDIPTKNIIDNSSEGKINDDDGLILSSNNPLRFLELNKINSTNTTLNNDDVTCGMNMTCAVPAISSHSFLPAEKSSIPSSHTTRDSDDMTCGMEMTCAVPVISSRSFLLTDKSSVASTQPLSSNMDFTCDVPFRNVMDNSNKGKITDKDGLISSSNNPLRFLELSKINSNNAVHDDDGMEMTCTVPVISSHSFSQTEKSSIASTTPIRSSSLPTNTILYNSAEKENIIPELMVHCQSFKNNSDPELQQTDRAKESSLKSQQSDNDKENSLTREMKITRNVLSERRELMEKSSHNLGEQADIDDSMEFTNVNKVAILCSEKLDSKLPIDKIETGTNKGTDVGVMEISSAVPSNFLTVDASYLESQVPHPVRRLSNLRKDSEDMDITLAEESAIRNADKNDTVNNITVSIDDNNDYISKEVQSNNSTISLKEKLTDNIPPKILGLQALEVDANYSDESKVFKFTSGAISDVYSNQEAAENSIFHSPNAFPVTSPCSIDENDCINSTRPMEGLLTEPITNKNNPNISVSVVCEDLPNENDKFDDDNFSAKVEVINDCNNKSRRKSILKTQSEQAIRDDCVADKSVNFNFEDFNREELTDENVTSEVEQIECSKTSIYINEFEDKRETIQKVFDLTKSPEASSDGLQHKRLSSSPHPNEPVQKVIATERNTHNSLENKTLMDAEGSSFCSKKLEFNLNLDRGLNQTNVDCSAMGIVNSVSISSSEINHSTCEETEKMDIEEKNKSLSRMALPEECSTLQENVDLISYTAKDEEKETSLLVENSNEGKSLCHKNNQDSMELKLQNLKLKVHLMWTNCGQHRKITKAFWSPQIIELKSPIAILAMKTLSCLLDEEMEKLESLHFCALSIQLDSVIEAYNSIMSLLKEIYITKATNISKISEDGLYVRFCNARRLVRVSLDIVFASPEPPCAFPTILCEVKIINGNIRLKTLEDAIDEIEKGPRQLLTIINRIKSIVGRL